MQSELEQAKLSAPPESKKLAQGEDLYPIEFKFDTTDKAGDAWTWDYLIDISWDDIFWYVGPTFLNEANENDIYQELSNMVSERSEQKRTKDENLQGHTQFRSFIVNGHDVDTIMIQLRALGLISKSVKSRSLKDTNTYWVLTPYGDRMLTSLHAIPKEENTEDEGYER